MTEEISHKKPALLLAVLVVVVIVVGLAYRDSRGPGVLEIGSASELADYYDSIGYNLDTNPDAVLAVPRTRFLHVPRDWTEPEIPLLKSVFLRAAASGILQVNEAILADRERLLSIDLVRMSKKDRVWLGELMIRYRVGEPGAPPTVEHLAELSRRVDAVPPSLALAQAAVESGWFRSRFAIEGNALFGQRTTSRNGLKARDGDARLAVFPTPRDSIFSYARNLNTYPAYEAFRDTRAGMRAAGREPAGYELAAHLESYSELGGDYVLLLREVIRNNGLQPIDSARLVNGPVVTIRPVTSRAN
ncbi:MAG: glucosaminidase domain-containing protein [Alphaproteobacteria bacterium]